MSSCQYKEVSTKSEWEPSGKGSHWKPFLRQLMVCSGVWTSIFLYGLNIGAPTVYIPQIRKEKSFASDITDDMASWLTSLSSFSGAFFILIMSFSIKFIGRRILNIIGSIEIFASCVVLYCSSSVTHILISSIMQGFFSALMMIIGMLVVTEYTSPKYRGLFLTIKAATLYWGIWVSNAIGTFFHWKMIPLFGIVCALYSFLTTLMWPESPYWLLSKGKFKECANSHRWLRGYGETSEKELEALINSQKEYIAQEENVKKCMKDHLLDILKTIKTKEFYKPTLLACTTGMLSTCSGKLVFTVYIIDIIKKITSSESTAYIIMLVLDGITIASLYIGCALARFLKRRTLLLGASFVGVMFLLVLSFYLYLIKLSVIAENMYISILLIMLYSIAVSCGPLILCSSVYGELIPIRSRNFVVCIITITGKIVIGSSLKISPFLFKTFGLHGAFLIFGISSLTIIIILYIYLPETKDKTLQEITESFNVPKADGKI